VSNKTEHSKSANLYWCVYFITALSSGE